MSEESVISDPYEAVLADLKAKRAQIDQLISLLETVRAPMPGVTLGIPTETGQTEGPGWLLGMTIPEAAKKVLATRRQQMKNAEIVAAFKAGGLVMNSVDPVNTVNSVLTRRFSDVGDIVRIGRGLWGLKEWYPGRSWKKEKAENGETKPEPPPSTVRKLPVPPTKTKEGGDG